MIEHLGDPGSGLRRARSLLRPSGLLFLVLPNYRNLITWFAMFAYRASAGRLDYPASRVHQIYHVSYFTQRSISRLLELQGFDPVAILYFFLLGMGTCVSNAVAVLRPQRTFVRTPKQGTRDRLPRSRLPVLEQALALFTAGCVLRAPLAMAGYAFFCAAGFWAISAYWWLGEP